MKPSVLFAVCLIIVSLSDAYVYRFSLIEPYSPSFLQFREDAIGTNPFGFSEGGSVVIEWTPIPPQDWNMSGGASTGGYFIDYMGHWRPPIQWNPSMAPAVMAAGLCPVEICINGGNMAPVSQLISEGTLKVVARWNSSSSFYYRHDAGGSDRIGHSVVVVWGYLPSLFSSDMYELQSLRISLLTSSDGHLPPGQRGLSSLYTFYVAMWSLCIVIVCSNQWMRRRVSTSPHAWHTLWLLLCRWLCCAWACVLWWLWQLNGSLSGDMVAWVTLGQVIDFWGRLAWQVGATVLALDAPLVTTGKPARTALVWMLLVALVAMFFSITFADLTWWLWGAMLLWTDVFLQLALTLSLLWIYRHDAQKGQAAGKRSKFADSTKCCYGVFSTTTLVPMSYNRALLVADSLRASPVWFRGDFLIHFALLETFHALFAIWLLLVVTARVARDDVRQRAFLPLSQSVALSEQNNITSSSASTSHPSTSQVVAVEPVEDLAVQMDVFEPAARAYAEASLRQSSEIVEQDVPLLEKKNE